MGSVANLCGFKGRDQGHQWPWRQLAALLVIGVSSLVVGCGTFPVYDARSSLPDRVSGVAAELAEIDPPLTADAQSRYLKAYRKGYTDGGVRKTGYLGRIDLSGRQKHPLQAAYERGHRDSGRDMSMKWEAPKRIDFRTHPYRYSMRPVRRFRFR